MKLLDAFLAAEASDYGDDRVLPYSDDLKEILSKQSGYVTLESYSNMGLLQRSVTEHVYAEDQERNDVLVTLCPCGHNYTVSDKDGIIGGIECDGFTPLGG